MKCTRCGNQLADNARVCGKCGQTVAKRPVSQKPVTPPASQPPQVSQPVYQSESKEQLIHQEPSKVQIPQKAPVQIKIPSPGKEAFFSKKKSSDQPMPDRRRVKLRRLITVFLIVLVVAAAGFGGYMLYRMHRDIAQIPNPEVIFLSDLSKTESDRHNRTCTYILRTAEDHSYQISYYLDCLKNANGIYYSESRSEKLSHKYADYREEFPDSQLFDDEADYPTHVFAFLEGPYAQDDYPDAVVITEYGWQDGFYKTKIVIYNVNNCEFVHAQPISEKTSTNQQEEFPLISETDAPFATEEETIRNEPEIATEPQNTEVKPSGNFSSAYITDGGEYTIAVGDSFTMYHPRTPTSPYYAYTWIVESGEECVEIDRDQGTCNVVGIQPGTVKLSANLDYTVVLGYSSESYSYEYEVTIQVKESGNYYHGDVTDGLCPRCHGARTVDCTVCYGDGKLSSGKVCNNCSKGKVICHYCDGSGTWK